MKGAALFSGKRPKLLDLFCGAGGAGMGYHRAGFDVTGVDVKPQPRYPFRFFQDDALEFLREHGHEYDVIHASPPCQAYSQLGSMPNVTPENRPDLVGATRELLIESGKYYIIENVPGAPLLAPIRLCGSSFGLRVRKHRMFETSHFVMAPPCQHHWQDETPIYTVRNRGTKRTGVCYVFGNGTGKGDDWPGAMGIDWMTRSELSQAIPPAYTEYIGAIIYKQLVESLQE